MGNESVRRACARRTSAGREVLHGRERGALALIFGIAALIPGFLIPGLLIPDFGSAFAQNRSRVVRAPQYGQVRLVLGQTLFALKPGTVQCAPEMVWEKTCLASTIAQMRRLNLARAAGFLPASETYDGAVTGEIIDIALDDAGWSAQWRLEGAVGIFVPKQCAALPGEGVRYRRGYEGRIEVILESQSVVCDGAAPPQGSAAIPQGESIPARPLPIGPLAPPAWPVWPAVHYPIREGERYDIVGVDPACPETLVLKDGICFSRAADQLAELLVTDPDAEKIVIYGSPQPLEPGMRLSSVAQYEFRQRKKGPSVNRRLFSGGPPASPRFPSDCVLAGAPEYLVDGLAGRFLVRTVQSAACGGPPSAPKAVSIVEFYGYAYPVARPGNCGTEDRLVGGNLCFGYVKAYMQQRKIDRLQAVLLYQNFGTGSVLETGTSKFDIALVTANPEFTEFTADRRARFSTGLESDQGCRSPAERAPSGVIVQGDGTALYWEWKECPE